MPEPYIGEIRIFPYNKVPQGWAVCDGQLLAISQNQALFSLLYTTYGGNGTTTFGLPDMRDRVVVGSSNDYKQGNKGGAATHTLTVAEMPGHNHPLNVSANKGTSDSPVGNVLAATPANVYTKTLKAVNMASGSISTSGKGMPHNNRQPYLALCYCIALTGIYPPRN